jgi:type VI secretion system secreted protein Hcp
MPSNIFLLLSDVEGESTHPEFRGAIEVLAWSWGALQSDMSQPNTTCSINDLSITKYADQATPELILACCSRRLLPRARLVCQGVSGAPYFGLDLDSVMVTSISLGASAGEDRMTENVALNFASFHVTYASQVEDGTIGPVVGPLGWDVVKCGPK